MRGSDGGLDGEGGWSEREACMSMLASERLFERCMVFVLFFLSSVELFVGWNAIQALLSDEMYDSVVWILGDKIPYLVVEYSYLANGNIARLGMKPDVLAIPCSQLK